jgi:hypothetical protein
MIINMLMLVKEKSFAYLRVLLALTDGGIFSPILPALLMGGID